MEQLIRFRTRLGIGFVASSLIVAIMIVVSVACLRSIIQSKDEVLNSYAENLLRAHQLQHLFQITCFHISNMM